MCLNRAFPAHDRAAGEFFAAALCHSGDDELSEGKGHATGAAKKIENPFGRIYYIVGTVDRSAQSQATGNTHGNAPERIQYKRYPVPGRRMVVGAMS
jgi:hypothetical protein